MLCQQAHALFSFLGGEKIWSLGRRRTVCNQDSKPRDSAATLGTRFISCVFRSEGFSKKIFAGASMWGRVGLRGNFLI